MALLERLEWVLANVPEFQGRGGQTKWSEKALKKRTHLGALMTKLRNGTASGADEKTLRLLAEAAGVSRLWLIDGTGDPRDIVVGVPGIAISPDTVAPKVLVDRPAMRDARAALARWTPDEWMTPEEIVSVREALDAEAFKLNDTLVNPEHWSNRIRQNVAALKGKRIEHVVHDDPVEERKRARRTTRS